MLQNKIEELRNNDAQNLAKLAIIENKMQLEDFEDKYGAGNDAGKSLPQKEFGYQFAVACADYTVQIIKEDQDNHLDVAITRFGKAILKLNSEDFVYAINSLKANLANAVKKYSVPPSSIKPFISLDLKTKTDICKIIYKLEDFDYDKKEIMINAISDFDKLPEDKLPEALRNKKSSKLI